MCVEPVCKAACPTTTFDKRSVLSSVSSALPVDEPFLNEAFSYWEMLTKPAHDTAIGILLLPYPEN